MQADSQGGIGASIPYLVPTASIPPSQEVQATEEASGGEELKQTEITPSYHHHRLAAAARSLFRNPPAEPHVVGNPRDEHPKIPHSCNCRRSNCLKLYCECFANGIYCEERCHCSGCYNNETHEKVRKDAIEMILDRNEHAFRPKIVEADATEATPSAGSATRHNKGCHCKRSNCLKKYCECFQAGVCCSAKCRCHDCKNYEDSEARSKLLEYNASIHQHQQQQQQASSPRFFIKTEGGPQQGGGGGGNWPPENNPAFASTYPLSSSTSSSIKRSPSEEDDRSGEYRSFYPSHPPSASHNNQQSIYPVPYHQPPPQQQQHMLAMIPPPPPPFLPAGSSTTTAGPFFQQPFGQQPSSYGRGRLSGVARGGSSSSGGPGGGGKGPTTMTPPAVIAQKAINMMNVLKPQMMDDLVMLMVNAAWSEGLKALERKGNDFTGTHAAVGIGEEEEPPSSSSLPSSSNKKRKERDEEEQIEESNIKVVVADEELGCPEESLDDDDELGEEEEVTKDVERLVEGRSALSLMMASSSRGAESEKTVAPVVDREATTSALEVDRQHEKEEVKHRQQISVLQHFNAGLRRMGEMIQKVKVTQSANTTGTSASSNAPRSTYHYVRRMG